MISTENFQKLFNQIHPHFFEQEYLRNFSDEQTFDEMLLKLSEFDFHKYEKTFGSDISFDFFNGNESDLQEAVNKVNANWLKYFCNRNQRCYCVFAEGKIASFCLLTDMGTFDSDGKKLKIAGPGCVGTVPEFRDRGLGLTMVKNATQILKEEGFDYSYIHYTAVAKWYAKLGYKTIMRWNKSGPVNF